MTTSRQPAVAGMFYPADPVELQQQLDGFLSKARAEGPMPKAIIAPHAGYIYSGPIAASAYARVAALREKISRVVILGPAHREPIHGLATSSADRFTTPLGNIPLDRESISSIERLPQVCCNDTAHQLEHSLEVQLPFLQQVLNNFTLVPLVIGDTTKEEVSEVLEQLWGGPETLIIISSDLSHYHDYETARKMDSATSRAIESLKPADIHYDDACGRNPISGLLVIANKLGLQAETLDLRNSGDTAGSRDSVVGYGAYVFH
ncbi:MAG: AmmeMemoRadiSam system protein B [Gammaproteobacteria bacterium]|nr:AmmeMemoRadiSam system protein B [Gammaproteobacteria bacterium]